MFSKQQTSFISLVGKRYFYISQLDEEIEDEYVYLENYKKWLKLKRP